MTDIYNEIDVAVHPSHSENLGGAGKSLALGVPTVSTNVGGFPDVVKDGITGFTVDKKNPKQLANRIIWMLEHPIEAKEMALKGRELCINNLDVSITAKHMAEIYDEICK